MRKLFSKARASVARRLTHLSTRRMLWNYPELWTLFVCACVRGEHAYATPNGGRLVPESWRNDTKIDKSHRIRQQNKTFGRLQIKIANKRRARNGKYSKLKSILGFRHKNVSNGYFSFDNPQLIASRRFHLFYRKGDASAPAAISFHHLIRFSARREGYRRSRLSAVRICIFWPPRPRRNIQIRFVYCMPRAHSVCQLKERNEKKNTENVRYDCSRDVPKQKAAGAMLAATLGLR